MTASYIPIMAAAFAFAGAACGIMINVALDHPWHDKGGILGGLIVGALMFFL